MFHIQMFIIFVFAMLFQLILTQKYVFYNYYYLVDLYKRKKKYFSVSFFSIYYNKKNDPKGSECTYKSIETDEATVGHA